MIGRKQQSAVSSQQSSVCNERISGKNPQFAIRNRQSADQSKIQNPKSKTDKGFSLLELMISMFILIILLSVALPTYQSSVQHARETVLRENLWQMRRAVDQYGTDKGKLPQSLDDLVKENYLREKPVDPITEKAEWNEIQGEDTTSADGTQGLKDVKSLADGEDGDGVKYQDY